MIKWNFVFLSILLSIFLLSNFLSLEYKWFLIQYVAALYIAISLVFIALWFPYRKYPTLTGISNTFSIRIFTHITHHHNTKLDHAMRGTSLKWIQSATSSIYFAVVSSHNSSQSQHNAQHNTCIASLIVCSHATSTHTHITHTLLAHCYGPSAWSPNNNITTISTQRVGSVWSAQFSVAERSQTHYYFDDVNYICLHSARESVQTRCANVRAVFRLYPSDGVVCRLIFARVVIDIQRVDDLRVWFTPKVFG